MGGRRGEHVRQPERAPFVQTKVFVFSLVDLQANLATPTVLTAPFITMVPAMMLDPSATEVVVVATANTTHGHRARAAESEWTARGPDLDGLDQRRADRVAVAPSSLATAASTLRIRSACQRERADAADHDAPRDELAGRRLAFDGSVVRFAPRADFNGTDSFTYTVSDDGTTNGVTAALTASALVTLTVPP